MITPVKYDKYGSSIVLKQLMTRGNMEDDQDNIKEINMKNRIDALEHECAVLKSNAQDDRMKSKNQMSRILRLEECEDLRDAQLKCLKDFIDKYLPTYIEKGGGHDWKVLDVPEAKK